MIEKNISLTPKSRLPLFFALRHNSKARNEHCGKWSIRDNGECKSMGRLLRYFLLGLGVLWCAGCAAETDRWTGSVDAVFRYRPKESSTVVFEVRDGSYSQKAGLKAGDTLLAVDGQDITGAAYENVRAALRAPVGTFAVLKVKRNDKILEIKIERRSIRSEKKGSSDTSSTK